MLWPMLIYSESLSILSLLLGAASPISLRILGGGRFRLLLLSLIPGAVGVAFGCAVSARVCVRVRAVPGAAGLALRSGASGRVLRNVKRKNESVTQVSPSWRTARGSWLKADGSAHGS